MAGLDRRTTFTMESHPHYTKEGTAHPAKVDGGRQRQPTNADAFSTSVKAERQAGPVRRAATRYHRKAKARFPDGSRSHGRSRQPLNRRCGHQSHDPARPGATDRFYLYVVRHRTEDNPRTSGKGVSGDHIGTKKIWVPSRLCIDRLCRRGRLDDQPIRSTDSRKLKSAVHDQIAWKRPSYPSPRNSLLSFRSANRNLNVSSLQVLGSSSFKYVSTAAHARTNQDPRK